VNYDNSFVVTITVTFYAWAPSSSDHFLHVAPSTDRHSAFTSPHPIHAADGHCACNSSCITLLWLHPLAYGGGRPLCHGHPHRP